MKDDFIFTQVKETVMTADKTVITIVEKLETIDKPGHKHCMKSSHSQVEYHNKGFDMRRAA